MLKLIKLECKKNQIGRYIRSAIILSFILLIFIIGIASELDNDVGIEIYGKTL